MTAPRKVLIVTYYWPPASGPGVQRVLKIAKYLPEFGWQPIILTPARGEFPALDETLLQEVPPATLVVKTASLEPNVLYKKFVGIEAREHIPLAVLAEEKLNWRKKLAHWVRLNFFIPDAKIGWYPFALRAGKKIIRRHKPQLILSSSPPPTVQLIAKKLARWGGLKWVADFRDPWTDIFYYQKQTKLPLSEKLDRRLEQSVLQQADKVLAVSPSNLRRLSQKADPAKFHVLYNGYDAADMHPPRRQETSEENLFSLVFVGNMKATHNCEALWRALQNSLKEDPRLRKAFRLKFIGLSHASVQQSLENTGLLEKTDFMGFQSHHIAVRQMQAASVLLFIIPDAPDNRGILTGKIFEYLAAGRPILAVGPPDGDAAKLLHECRAGSMLDRNDIKGMTKRILELFDKWQRQALQEDVPDPEKVARYERKTLVGHLAQMMNELLEGDSHA